MKTLFITVGGSPQPILTSVKSLNPDRVVFICSDGPRGSQSQIIGEGKPCEVRQGGEVVDRLPNIPTQLGLGDRFDRDRDVILVSNPDDLSECYGKIAQKVREARNDDANAQLLADYTGGTKTMSVALAQVALDDKLETYVTSSTRRDNLVKVERGERVRRATTSAVTVERTILQVLPAFLRQYNYPAAIAELETLLQERELSGNNADRVQLWLDCCTGFDLWDRFDHAEAWFYLKDYVKYPQLREPIFFLKRVMASREAFAPAAGDGFTAPESMRGHGYEIVEDMLLNAERRSTLARYDDAVARLYRTLELLAQMRLWEAYEIKTGDVALDKLPEALRSKYEAFRAQSGKIQIPLFKAYTLLTEFPDDPVGKEFASAKGQIQDALQVRNYSILAHGLRPVTESDYRQLEAAIEPFVRKSIAAVVSKKSPSPAQFPSEWEM